ncbi:MAG TPA: OmpA family protein [Allosphingosinicella sp.]|nr:OmpA family protein [Allosphingosinicella sp.]
MRGLTFCAIAATMLVAAGPAGACAPPSIRFGLGSARIDAMGRQAIDEVVNEYRARRGGRVQLRATTDGLGPAAANLRLARRRGEAVKAALVRRGVPASAIDIIAEGEGRRRGAIPEDRLVWLVVVDGGCSG